MVLGWEIIKGGVLEIQESDVGLDSHQVIQQQRDTALGGGEDPGEVINKHLIYL